ncbi:MAG: hypothetical protein K2F91_09450 [Muribaculaceae bacterium]|nr:hypothetical protein [Muribaculaceae bacterium]
MLTFLRYLLQLILAPAKGWEDIEASDPDPELLTRKALYPLTGIAAATEFLALFYSRGTGLPEVLMRATALFGTYFTAVFIARLIFELYLGRLTTAAPDSRRTSTMTVCGIGLMVLVRMLENCLPWNLVLLKFLPIYVVLVLYKAIPYIGVRRDSELSFTGLAAAAIVGVPLAIYYLLYLIIQ